jgi:hypothetical protein
MIKYIQLLLFIIIFPSICSFAQQVGVSAGISSGYYQSVNLNPETPCTCDQKTQRTHDLAKGLIPGDVNNYNLYAYSFSFGSNTNAASKLFKAFENDVAIYKISMKEWSSFMLLTTKDFDVSSFEIAAKQVFATFVPITPEDFLKIKNTTSYYEYIQAKQELDLMQQQKTLPVKN